MPSKNLGRIRAFIQANRVSVSIINPIQLGGGQIDPPSPKKIFIFKWHLARLCDLMTFIGNIRGSFWPNLGVIGNFFELLQMFKVKMRPQKTAKNRLFKF